MIIVAVGHHKNVGKDRFVAFCFDFLRGQGIKKKISKRGFAEPVYEMCHRLYSWAGFKTKVHYDSNPNAKNDMLATGKTVRQTLIDVGQHMRKYDDMIWVNCALRTIDSDILFLTDLRFPTEFNECVARDAIMVRVTRPGLPKPTDEADIALDGWEDKWNFTINNNHGLDALYAEAQLFCEQNILRKL